MMSDTQSKAIEAYCYEQWEMGMGATKKMVYAAICFLVGGKAPSWRWFQKWLKNTPALCTIKTKPIARNRIETHTEKDLEKWFEKYRCTLDKYKIRSGRNIYNMDESGVRVGCPTGEEVVVPTHTKELYTASPENRKSVTIIEAISADGRKPPPPFVICPGKRIMESWIHDNLKGSEVIALSPTGYTNESIAIAWLRHFIKHTNAGPGKPWKMLLLDGHVTHENDEFVILAHENNVKPFEYPSHLTHVLQPLDVGVFRPWKHYHNKAIHHALRNLDYEYTITSLFRDLSNIREQTFKEYTIKNAFRNSGMWPVSFKAAKKKMREYSNKNLKRKLSEEGQLDDDANDLPILPQHLPRTYQECSKAFNEWEFRVPHEFSSPSRKRYKLAIAASKIHLGRASLQQQDHRAIQNRLFQEQRARATNRKSLNYGGPLDIEKARATKRAKEQRRRDEAIRKAKKAIDDFVKKAKKDLNRRGVDARRAERERKKAFIELEAKGESIPAELYVVIRDPEKDPTPDELESLEPHPSLVQALNDLLNEPFQDSTMNINFQLLEDEGLEIQLRRAEEAISAIEDREMSDNEDILSDNESDTSLDSIALNADFVSF